MTIYEGADLTSLMDTPRSAEVRRHYHAVDITESVWNRMQELGINQTQLAERLGKSSSTVSRMLSAQGNLTLQSVSELEEALGITLIDTTPYVPAEVTQSKPVIKPKPSAWNSKYSSHSNVQSQDYAGWSLVA